MRSRMRFRLTVIFAAASLFLSTVLILQAQAARAAQRTSTQSQSVPAYFPGRFTWEHKQPQEVGMDAALLNEAVQQAIATENAAPKEMMIYLATTFGATEPLDTPIGPIKDRSAANGLIVRHGYIVAECGDPKRVDMTFSVPKTFLTTLVGLAWQRGLIRDVRDYARDYMPPTVDLFEAPHNQKIKWDDLLRQTSDWQGTLW